MPGAHECQLGKIDQNRGEMRRGLVLVAFAPVFDSLQGLKHHLPNHYRQHGFA
ncbi:hypothetical protein D3C72_2483690 [compost metagenome]